MLEKSSASCALYSSSSTFTQFNLKGSSVTGAPRFTTVKLALFTIVAARHLSSPLLDINCCQPTSCCFFISSMAHLHMSRSYSRCPRHCTVRRVYHFFGNGFHSVTPLPLYFIDAANEYARCYVPWHATHVNDAIFPSPPPSQDQGYSELLGLVEIQVEILGGILLAIQDQCSITCNFSFLGKITGRTTSLFALLQ